MLGSFSCRTVLRLTCDTATVRSAQKMRQERREQETWEIISQLDFLELQYHQCDSEHQQSHNRVHGQKKGLILRKPLSKLRATQRDCPLEGEHGQSSQKHTPTEHPNKPKRRQAIYNSFYR